LLINLQKFKNINKLKLFRLN